MQQMSDDRSGQTSKSRLGNLAQPFSDEPRSREDIMEVLYEAGENGVLRNNFV